MVKAPKMTKAHFKYLAGLMVEIQPDPSHVAEYNQWVQTVRGMAIALTWTNDNFDKAEFKAACGDV